jgi:hypothetical protein
MSQNRVEYLRSDYSSFGKTTTRCRSIRDESEERGIEIEPIKSGPALDPPQATGDLTGAPHLAEDYLILSTVHSAKGQEWNSVYVLKRRGFAPVRHSSRSWRSTLPPY